MLTIDDLNRIVSIVDTYVDGFDGICIAMCGAWHRSPLVFVDESGSISNEWIVTVDVEKSIADNVITILEYLRACGYSVDIPFDLVVEE